MCCGANFAWNNRQLITYGVRNAFSKVLGQSSEALGMDIVYDVCHNIGKVEDHVIDGARHKVVVHRKGATRAFPAGHPETPAEYHTSELQSQSNLVCRLLLEKKKKKAVLCSPCTT